MKKIIKYELTQEEKDLLTKCAREVAQNCDCECQEENCPFFLEHEQMCILEKLEDIVSICE